MALLLFAILYNIIKNTKQQVMSAFLGTAWKFYLPTVPTPIAQNLLGQLSKVKAFIIAEI